MKKPLPPHSRRLAQLVLRPGGITASEAVAAAELKLEGLRDRGLSEIAATISRMQALAFAIPPNCPKQQGNELYVLSNSLVGIAGVFGKDGLGSMALSLCTLIERLLLAQRWDKPAVALHLDSMRLLCENTISAAELATIESALEQVVKRVHTRPKQDSLN